MPISPRASEIGLPALRDSRRASSTSFFSSAFASRRSRAERSAGAAGHRERAARVPLRRARVVAKRLDDQAHLAARVGDRLAGATRIEGSEPLELLLERVREPVEQGGAIAGRDRPPGGEGPLGAR